MSKIAPKLTDYLEVAVANAPEQFRPMGRELRALKAVARAAERIMRVGNAGAQGEWEALYHALARLRAPERP